MHLVIELGTSKHPNGGALLDSADGGSHMTNKKVPHLVRADDFVADSLEEMVGKMPPSDNAHAEYFLSVAKRLRESGRTKMVRVWENEREAQEFISPDPASVRR